MNRLVHCRDNPPKWAASRGTLAYGFTGLFLGPIVLAVIWELWIAWIKDREDRRTAT